MALVLDASALLSYLQKETGHEKVTEAFAKASESEKPLLMCAVNWGEVYYVLARGRDLEEVQAIMDVVETLPIELIPADKEIAKSAALYKTMNRLPYADSFAAATAEIHKGALLTADREFKSIEGDIKITWL